MKYELHKLNNRKLPFIFRDDEMVAGEKDFTHWHENVEILFFYEGEGVVTADFRQTLTKKGDFFIINSEKLHMVESAHASSPVRYYCLILDEDFCAENGIPASDLQFREHISGDAGLEKKFRAVVDAYRGGGEFREAAVRAAALELLLELARGYRLGKEDQQNADERHLDSVKEAIRYIKEHYERPMSVDEISRAAGLSKAYFSRIFRAVTGCTVVSYINIVRCRNAAKLLSSGRYKVGEAAARCGFENMSYFTRTYKQIMGVLPSKE
ncbi:MAG: helix-turn-helix transcriptional regulator [Clostridia bacterium]|nr:helix-turn-helix transcriptional regulator [Clostridia bacterium]